MAQSQILNANFDWLQAGKKEVMPEYKIDTQKTIFDRIEKAKRSTFDRSKFTVVGSPTITDNGIASGFATSNYLVTNYIVDIINANNIDINLSFKTDNNVTTAQWVASCNIYTQLSLEIINNKLLINTGKNNTWAGDEICIDNLQANTNYYIKMHFTTTGYEAWYSTNGITYTRTITANKTMLGDVNNMRIRLGVTRGATSPFTGSIDLKQFSITVDGIEVFNGNKTGVDQVTSTLQIPYTQSKTGAKIVDAVYRDRVQYMYEQFGYTHYYTIGDDDYTLQTVPNEKIVDSYYADNSFMELTADLSLTQGGGAVSGQTVNLKRPYVNNKYIATIGTTSKDTNSFVAGASGQWITKGKGVLE